MAVFLLKAKNGLCYVPPPCTGIFPDVPCPSTFASWIEALSAAGITGGCGGGNYCPTSPVTRQQMAVFLLKTKHGSTYVPPACSGDFADVPCPSQFADWIEQLAAGGITGRLRRRQLLSDDGGPARPDGRVPLQHVPASVKSAMASLISRSDTSNRHTSIRGYIRRAELEPAAAASP